MRKVERMGPFLERVEELWKEVPDLRFGQLMCNFIHEKGEIVFVLEEDKFLEELANYTAKIGQNYHKG